MSQREKSFGAEQFVVTQTVTSPHHNWRLDQFMQLYLKTLSREFVKTKIQRGEILITNRPGRARPSSRVHRGDTVQLTAYESGHEVEYWQGRPISVAPELPIIFDSSSLLVVEKPAFISTHPTGKHLFRCATVMGQSQCGSPVANIHRLDRETSGVLVLSKKAEVTSKLTLDFERKKVRKAYFLVAKSEHARRFHEGEKITSQRRLMADFKGLRPFVTSTSAQDQKGKAAWTRFLILKVAPPYVAALAFPLTGRSHQIRVHAKDEGLPLLGDKLYGKSQEAFGRFKSQGLRGEDYRELEIPRHALHAMALQFTDRAELPLFQAALPWDLRQWRPDFIDEALEREAMEAIKTYFRDERNWKTPRS